MLASKLRTKIIEQSIGATMDSALRKIVLRYWRNRSHLTVKMNDQIVRLNVRKKSTDAEVVWQCFSLMQYQIPMVVGGPTTHRNAVKAMYMRSVSSGKTPLIIDCGANIGASTAWLKMKYPNAAIVAIEPAPDNYRLLAQNCRQFGNIDPVHAGIGPRDEDAFLQDIGGGAWGYQTGSEETETKVKLVSLSTLLSLKKQSDHLPFILKIDIEGAEKDLFSNESYAIFDQFPVIIFESHDFSMPAQGTSSPFFRFHAETGRDFLFGNENIFSVDMKTLLPFVI